MKNLKNVVYFYCLIGFVALLLITIKASSSINVLDGAANLWVDDWFKATIVDFYNNQILIFFWVAYKETNPLSITIFFILSIFFGSFFSIGYVLFHLVKEKNIKNLICKTKRQL